MHQAPFQVAWNVSNKTKIPALVACTIRSPKTPLGAKFHSNIQFSNSQILLKGSVIQCKFQSKREQDYNYTLIYFPVFPLLFRCLAKENICYYYKSNPNLIRHTQKSIQSHGKVAK